MIPLGFGLVALLKPRGCLGSLRLFVLASVAVVCKVIDMISEANL